MASSPASRPLQTLTFSLLFAMLSGWLLYIGKDLLIPILAALIAVYILVTAADWLQRLALFRRWPVWARRLLVLLGFLAAGVFLIGIIAATAEQVVQAAPRYQENLEALLARASDALGLDQQPSWQSIRAATVGKMHLQPLLAGLLGSIGALLGTTTMIAIYMAFLLGERGHFARKLAVALPGQSAENTARIIRDINGKIGNYLATKTLINIILGLVSYVVLWMFGVDFALFWALLIALANYIPYIGSFVGVVFPVLLSLAQFGTLQTALFLALLLTAVQFYIGNILEPKMIGKQVNLSPFVVLVALSLWAGLWGIAGAILAIPLTSMLAIILAAFPDTRPLAVLLADDVGIFEEDGGAAT